MKNLGLKQLVLVNPQCNPVGGAARLMAVRGVDLLQAAQVVPSLAEALQDCRRVVATTGRDRTALSTPLEPPRRALPWLVPPTGGAAAIVFGREDSGLSNDELNLAQRWLHIPSSDDYASLNLAQAVAICCYELSLAAIDDERHRDPPAALEAAPPSLSATSLAASLSEPLAPRQQLEQYFADLQNLLLHTGYLQPHTAHSRMEKLRQLVNRAYPTESEMALLRGMVRQGRWALHQHPDALPRVNAAPPGPTPDNPPAQLSADLDDP
jgi:tRNA/rRNA methyltransferase